MSAWGMRKNFLWIFFLLTTASIIFPCRSFSKALSPTEYQVKAAFIYNFLSFVQWPASDLDKKGPVGICILGEDPFGSELDVLQKKRIRGRSIVIRRLRGLEEVGGCDVLFISRSEKRSLKRIIRSIGNKGILTVGDMEGFGEEGGIIQFYIKDRKVRFLINRRAAERAGLRISSKLFWLSGRR